MASSISKIAHKVTDKIDQMAEKNNKSNQPGSTNYGHAQGHDGYSTSTGLGGVGSSNTHSTNTGYGATHTGTHNTSSGFGTTGNTSYHNPQSANAGPHNSGMMNKLDPRIDSDRDGRNDPTSHAGGYGHTQTGYGSNVGTHTGVDHHNTSSGFGSSNTNTAAHGSTQSTNAGPHNSNLLNKLDPRVDSDMDGRNNPASHTGGYGQTQGNYGSGISHTGTSTAHHATTGHGHANTSAASYDNPQSTNAGPHKSNVLNKLDPRVDSDRDGRNDPTSHAGGYGQTQTGYGTTTTTTHHPTVVSQTTHTGNQGYTGTNTGYGNPQSTNAGPHKSNLLNKIDPRVDSDRDGRNDPSSRVGGYGNTQTGAPTHY